jgi:alpha-D-ribose 1-methylphosphonate 5-triphosphate diphosphatase
MADLLPPLRLMGADVLTAEGFAIGPVEVLNGQFAACAAATEVDLSGYWLLPGIIDLHGDGFERQLFPRPSAPFPIRDALAATDREAAAHGVTTAYLAQSWSWEGGMRSPDQAERVMQAVLDWRQHALTDLRVQIRAETHLIDAVPRLIAAVERFRIDYVVFNDHIEEGLTMQRRNPDGFATWARKAGLTPQDLSDCIDAAWARTKEVPRALLEMAEAFDRMGVTYGSHDDRDAETREVYRIIGARIAEFPTTRRAAAAAKAGGDPVLMGAPNVVRGGSQAGNIAAVDILREGLCDGLVSDYHIPALALAVWKLVDDGVLPLEKAWALVSSSPARVLGMVDRGEIAPGLRADLVAVNKRTRAVEMTIAGGRLAHLSGPAAGRFFGQVPARMAAE